MAGSAVSDLSELGEVDSIFSNLRLEIQLRHSLFRVSGGLERAQDRIGAKSVGAGVTAIAFSAPLFIFFGNPYY